MKVGQDQAIRDLAAVPDARKGTVSL